MIGKIFGKRNSKTSKKIVASIMMPIFVLQMCSLNLLLASPALAEFTAVGPPVDTNCSDSSYTVAVKHHNGSIDRCFKTIQAAVDDSSTETGDNINVKKAKYEEKVTVNKGVTISGEKDADLTGQFTISSDSVTVEGMDITNSGDSFGIIATDVSHLTFKNNAIHDIGTTLDNGSAQAIGIVSSAKDVTDVHIEKNDISNIGNKSMLHNGSDGSSAKGVYLGNSGGSKTISDVTISDNDMTKIYASTASWKGSSVGYGGGAGAYGILVNHKTENLKVEDNKINILEGLWSHAIGLEADTPDAEVSGNTINNLKDHKNGADSMALRLESNPSATDITLDNNKFNGKKLSIDTSTVFVNAAWVSLKPDTSNTYPEVLNAPTYLYYGINAFSNIQDAVKGVANKGTINVADGTYVETGQIVIDKDLSIVGHSKTKTIIKPAQDTAGTIHDPSSGWFSVVSGKTFNLNKVTLDGSEKNILAGIFSKGHGIIENTNFNNIHYAKYAGIGIELYGSNMTISENSFNNIERIGVFNGNNTDSKIIGNVYTGKGEGDWLDYAFEVGRGSKADINGNTILNNKGVAYDGSTSAGILVTSCYGPSSSQATITGNKISKCTDGIAVGYDANDTSVVVAHKNKLSGNVNGVSSTKPLVDATENWWGSASGPTDKISGDGSYLDTNPAGKGSVALGAVKYAPWYTNAGMTDETSPNAITNDASGISLYDATLNGTNGDYDATGHSFWVSLAPFATASPNIPSGVYSTPDFGPIAADADFNVALSLVTTQGIHSNMPAITPNTKYYYVAWSRVGNVWYPGEMKNFTTAPLLAPTLIAPENNSFVKGIPTLTNSWSSVPSAVKYEYESYHDEGMDNLRYSDTYTETSKTADNVSDATFWWHVRAVDAAGNKGPWSDLWKVTIDNTAPTTPQFSSPADNSFTNVNTITLKWTDGDDAGSGVKGYTFRYVFYPANGGNPVVDWSSGFVAGIQKMRSGSFGHGEGRYVMYVKTTDNAGNESLESNPLTITYDNIAPTVALDFAGTGANVTGFKAVFSEDVNKADAENPAHYFLHNWPGLGDTDLFGHADIIYDQTTHTTTVKFKTYGWYVSPEQEWGVENIHDLAGNLLVKNPYAETSTPMVAPVTTDSGTDDNWHNSAVTVSLNCTDVDGSGCKKTYYTTNGTDPTIASPSGNAVTLSAEGVYTIKYFSVDNAGNVEDVKTAVKTVNIDMTAPVVSITAPAAGFVKGTVDIRGTVTEEHPDHYWLAIYKKSNNQEIFSTVVNHTDQFENQALYLWDTTKVDDGEYQIKFAERDLDYNTGNRSSDFVTDVAVDNTKPTSTITGGDNNGIIYYNDWNGIVTGTSSDALSGVKGVKVSVQRTSDNKYWNGTAWQMDEITNDAAGTTAWSYNINTVLTENVYTIKSHAVDEMGNVENTYTLTIVFDKTIPEVNLSIDSNSPDGDNGWYDSTPEITLTASDNTKLDKIEYQIDSQTGAWTTYALPVKIDDGKHIFYYRSLDLAKNYSNVGSKNVKVDAQDPPTVKGVSAQYDKNKNAVKLNWDASDDDIYKVYIYKGDNKHFAINSGSRIAENDDNNEDLTDSDVETSEKYYYKFVSVDEAGNKSDTKIIAISIKPDGGATVTDEGVENTPAGAVAGANATENQDQASEAQSAAEGQEGQNGGNGQVEGTSITNDSASAQPHRNWWWVLAVAIVFFLGVEYQRRKKKMNLPKMN